MVGDAYFCMWSCSIYLHQNSSTWACHWPKGLGVIHFGPTQECNKRNQNTHEWIIGIENVGLIQKHNESEKGRTTTRIINLREHTWTNVCVIAPFNNFYISLISRYIYLSIK